MLLQIILEIGLTLAIKIDQLRLCLILNNYIATHILRIIFTISLLGLHFIRLMVSLLDLQPQINKLIVSNDPRRLSAIFLNQSVRYCFDNYKIKNVIQGVNNHFDS